MSNRQLKSVTKVIRGAEVNCLSMKDYYDEHQLYCDVFECILIGAKRSTSDISKTCIVRCCNIGKQSTVNSLYNELGYNEITAYIEVNIFPRYSKALI